MGKKNKEKKEKKKALQPKDVDAKDNKENEEEAKDKVSLKKCFRDTVIIMGLLIVTVGIVWFVNRDATATSTSNGEGGEDQPVEQEVEVNETILAKKLMGICNKELNKERNEDIRDKDYVSSICSFEYRPDKVTFCCAGNKVEGENWFIKVTIASDFKSELDFATKMCSLGPSYILDDYEVRYDHYEGVVDDALSSEFSVKFAPRFTGFSSTTGKYFMYKNPELVLQTYFTLIYIDSDAVIHSTNQIEYDAGKDDIDYTTEYRCYNPDTVIYKMMKNIIGIE